MNVLYKTKMCNYQMAGNCRHGNSCLHAHSEEEIRPSPDFRKTKLCRMFQRGLCTNIDCNRAHGEEERRIVHKFYKTKICKYWRDQGTCIRGSECYFAHNECYTKQISSVCSPTSQHNIFVPSNLNRKDKEYRNEDRKSDTLWFEKIVLDPVEARLNNTNTDENIGLSYPYLLPAHSNYLLQHSMPSSFAIVPHPEMTPRTLQEQNQVFTPRSTDTESIFFDKEKLGTVNYYSLGNHINHKDNLSHALIDDRLYNFGNSRNHHLKSKQTDSDSVDNSKKKNNFNKAVEDTTKKTKFQEDNQNRSPIQFSQFDNNLDKKIQSHSHILDLYQHALSSKNFQRKQKYSTSLSSIEYNNKASFENQTFNKQKNQFVQSTPFLHGQPMSASTDRLLCRNDNRNFISSKKFPLAIDDVLNKQCVSFRENQNCPTHMIKKTFELSEVNQNDRHEYSLLTMKPLSCEGLYKQQDKNYSNKGSKQIPHDDGSNLANLLPKTLESFDTEQSQFLEIKQTRNINSEHLKNADWEHTKNMDLLRCRNKNLAKIKRTDLPTHHIESIQKKMETKLSNEPLDTSAQHGTENSNFKFVEKPKELPANVPCLYKKLFHQNDKLSNMKSTNESSSNNYTNTSYSDLNNIMLSNLLSFDQSSLDSNKTKQDVDTKTTYLYKDSYVSSRSSTVSTTETLPPLVDFLNNQIDLPQDDSRGTVSVSANLIRQRLNNIHINLSQQYSMKNLIHPTSKYSNDYETEMLENLMSSILD